MKTLLLALTLLAVAVLLLLGCRTWLDTPVVHVSWSTKECVRVIGPEGHEHSCANLPERYERVWVK